MVKSKYLVGANPGQKLRDADHELILLALQYDRGFARRKGGAALDNVGPAAIRDLLSGSIGGEFPMIRLGIDLFHGLVS